MTTATKAIPGSQRLRTLFRRIREGVNFVLPRPGPLKPPSREDQNKYRRVLEKYQAQFNSKVNELAGQVATGDITPREFRAKMLIEIRYMEFTAVATMAGGIGYLDAEDIARVDDSVRRQAHYLDRWVGQLERQPVENRSEAQLQHRARLYGGSGTRLAEQTLDRKVFKEWPNLPFHRADRTLCKNHCACGWRWHIIDEVKGDADVYWELDWVRKPLEHCPTCVARHEDFYPLQIRNWQFVNMPTDLTDYLDV